MPTKVLRVRLHGSRDWLIGHPVLAATSIALVVRVLTAIGSFVVNRTYLIGDELQYMQLADHVARGHTADSWYPFYGQTLYDSTWVFIAPITFLFEVFGPSRLLAQLWSVLFGVVTVAVASSLAMRITDRRRALALGLLVALLPSQVLWSSVALRESMVWATLVVVAWAAVSSADPSWRRAVVATAVGLGALLAMARLRDQTFIVAVWALVPGVLIGGGRRYLLRLVGAAGLAVLLPMSVGLGPAGYDLVRAAAPSLGTTRTTLALHAETGFAPTESLGPIPQTPATTARSSGSGASAIADRGGNHFKVQTKNGPRDAIAADDGQVYEVREGLWANVRAVPTGLAAVLLRPFPWEHTTSFSMAMAKVEAVLWYGAYAVGLLGLSRGWRRNRLHLAYPFFLTGFLMGVGALTQGNLGTAFRHRGQIVWAIVVFAACAFPLRESAEVDIDLDEVLPTDELIAAHGM